MDRLIAVAGPSPTFAAFPAPGLLDGICRQLNLMRNEDLGEATMIRVLGVKDGKGVCLCST